MCKAVEPQPVAWRWKHPKEDRWQYGPNHPGDDERSAYVVEPLFSEALRSERDALREALKPFAPLADMVDQWRHEEDSTCMHRIKAVDLRRARAALASTGDRT